MYYAEYCPYGARAASDGDTLIAFYAKKDRDAYVSENENYANALSSEEARSRYGKRACAEACEEAREL